MVKKYNLIMRLKDAKLLSLLSELCKQYKTEIYKPDEENTYNPTIPHNNILPTITKHGGGEF